MKTNKIDYEPSNMEILGRICKDGAKETKDFGKWFLGTTAGFTLGLPYALPYTMRKLFVEDTLVIDLDSGAKFLGMFAGCVGTLISGAGQIVAYQYAINKGYPEVLGIPIATNLVSLGYEMYRSAKNSLREEYKSQVNSESSGIDKIVQDESKKNLC